MKKKVYVVWCINMDEYDINEIYTIYGIYSTRKGAVKTLKSAEKLAKIEGQDYWYAVAKYELLD